MKREFALLLAVCAFAAAMVPRERRAVDTEAVTEATKNICAPTTPCGWTFYNTYNKLIMMEVPNTYCVCADDSTCEDFEDDTAVNSFIKRCKKT